MNTTVSAEGDFINKGMYFYLIRIGIRFTVNTVYSLSE